MRKYLRAMAKAKMRKEGVTKINRRMGFGNWRRVVGAYPGFSGLKKQQPGSKQRILQY